MDHTTVIEAIAELTVACRAIEMAQEAVQTVDGLGISLTGGTLRHLASAHSALKADLKMLNEEAEILSRQAQGG